MSAKGDLDPRIIALLAELQRSGIPCSQRELLRVGRLFALADDLPSAELAATLASLLATNPNELAQIRRIATLFLERPVPKPPPVVRVVMGELATWLSWRVLGVALVLAIAAFYGTVLFLRPKTLQGCGEPCTVEAGSHRRFEVEANDLANRLGESTLELTRKPTLGEIKPAADGSWIYSAGQQLGKDHFTYLLRHWSGIERGQVDLEVLPVVGNVAPKADSNRRYRRYPDVIGVAGKPRFQPSSPPTLWSLLAPVVLWTSVLGIYAGFLSWARRTRKTFPLDWNPSDPRRFRPGEVGGPPEPWLSPDDLARLADVPVAIATGEKTDRLDADATIRRVTRDLRPDLCFEDRRESLRLLLLVDQQSAALAWNPLIAELAQGLLVRGLPTEVRYFFGTLVMERELAEALDRPEELLLLVCSDGSGLQPADAPMLSQLAELPRLAWLDPREPRFWDARTEVIEKRGIRIYPASREGIAAAFDALVSPRGGRLDEVFSVANLRRRGLLVRPRQQLPACIEEILGDGLAWAQECAMIQPISLGLAQQMRERFHPALPAQAIGRLVALPGTRVTSAGLTFDDSVLAHLREGFPLFHDEAETQAVFGHILSCLEAVRPEQDEDRPGMALLAWEALYQRVRLEQQPASATLRLCKLASTPLGPAIRADLAKLDRHWRRPEPGFQLAEWWKARWSRRTLASERGTIPLLNPPPDRKTMDLLDTLAGPGTPGPLGSLRLRLMEFVVLVMLTIPLLFFFWSALEQSLEPEKTDLRFGVSVEALGDAVPWNPVRFRVSDGNKTWDETLTAKPTSAYLSTTADMPKAGQTWTIATLSQGRRKATNWSPAPDTRGGTLLMELRPFVDDAEPCFDTSRGGLTVQVCPENETGLGVISLPSRVAAEVSVAIELAGDVSRFRDVRAGLLASSEVDAVYRFDVDLSPEEALKQVEQDLGAWGPDAKILWLAAPGFQPPRGQVVPVTGTSEMPVPGTSEIPGTGTSEIPPPQVVVVMPKDGERTSLKNFKVVAVATSSFFPLTELRVTRNGWLINMPAASRAAESATSADLRSQGTQNGNPFQRIEELEIDLLPGPNVFTFTAATERSRSLTETRTVFYDAPAGDQPSAGKPSLAVLAVGISDYRDLGLRLQYADDDARDVASLFKSQEGKAFSKVSTQVLDGQTPVTREALLHALSWLKNEAPGKNSIRLLFLSGHGEIDSAGNYYFLAQDHDPNADLEIKSLRWEVLIDKLMEGEITNSILIVDTCHAAAARGGQRANVNLTSQLKGRENLITFSASSEDQASLEGEGHGIFTEALLEGLRTLKADGRSGRPRDGVIEAAELGAWLVEAVTNKTGGRQRPSFLPAPGQDILPLFRLN